MAFISGEDGVTSILSTSMFKSKELFSLNRKYSANTGGLGIYHIEHPPTLRNNLISVER